MESPSTSPPVSATRGTASPRKELTRADHPTTAPSAPPDGILPWQRASLRLCCDHLSMVTVGEKRAAPRRSTTPTTGGSPTAVAAPDGGSTSLLSDASALFVGGRLSGVVNCCGTDSAYHLLVALAGREPPSAVTTTQGVVVFNGTPVTASAYQTRTAFLDDDFAPLESLTVRENLDYARSLRVAASSQAYTTDAVLEELALTSVKDVALSDCGTYVRRRVMLGKELLLNPSVLLLDHPLQGLATHEARQFLSVLRHIARPGSMSHAPRQGGGASPAPGIDDGACSSVSVSTTPPLPSRAAPCEGGTRGEEGRPPPPAEGVDPPSVRQERIVVLSMVQPRLVLLQLVDDVTLLVRDKVVYCGPLADLLRAPLLDPRPQLPLVCPTTTASTVATHDARATAPSPASDYFTKLVTRERRQQLFLQQVYEAASPGSFDVYTDRTTPAAAAGRGSPSSPPVSGANAPADNHITKAHLMAAMASTGNAAALRAEVDGFLSTCASGAQTLDSWRYASPSGARQLLYLCYYETRQLRHRWPMRVAVLALASLLSALLAWLYGRQDGPTGMQTRVGILFFLVSSTFLNTLLSTTAVRREHARFQRHRAQGYYSTLTYMTYRYAAIVVGHFAVGTCIALLVFLCTNFGSPWSDVSVFELMVVLVLTSICGSMTALLTCSACALLPAVHATIDQFVLLAVYTGNLLFAGLVLNLTTMPVVVQGLSFTSVTRLAFESSVLTQFHGRSFGCVPAGNESDGGSNYSTDANGTAYTVASAPRWAALDFAYRVAASGTITADNTTATPCYTGDSFAAFLGFDIRRRWLNALGLAVFSVCLLVCSLITMGSARSRRLHRSDG